MKVYEGLILAHIMVYITECRTFTYTKMIHSPRFIS